MKKMIWVWIILGVVVVVGIIVFVVMMSGKPGGLYGTTATPTVGAVTSPVATVAGQTKVVTTPVPASSSVSIENFSFNPGTLTVAVGTTVTWTNNDSTTHTVKSSSFNSSSLAPGDTFSFKFDSKGTFNYNCGIHPTMTGTIVVQ